VRARNQLHQLVADAADDQARVAVDRAVVDLQGLDLGLRLGGLDRGLEIERGTAAVRGLCPVQGPEQLRRPAGAVGKDVVTGPRGRVEALAEPRHPGAGDRVDDAVGDRVHGERDEDALGLAVQAS
jgi:hypothetical protein